MKQNNTQIKLDRSKLLGFKLDPITPATTGPSTKIGAKIGGKVGNKAGVKPPTAQH